jgi:hypothetical protein
MKKIDNPMIIRPFDNRIKNINNNLYNNYQPSNYQPNNQENNKKELNLRGENFNIIIQDQEQLKLIEKELKELKELKESKDTKDTKESI